MSDTPESVNGSAPTDVAVPSSNLESKQATGAETEGLLGTLRAAVVAAEGAKKNAADYATDAELARKRAMEHESAAAARLKEATEAAAKASALTSDAEAAAKQAAASSSRADSALAQVEERSNTAETLVRSLADSKAQAEKAAAETGATRDALVALLSDLAAKKDGLSTLASEMEGSIEALKQAVSDTNAAKADVLQSAATSKEKCEHVSDGEGYIQKERKKIAEYSTTAAEQQRAAQTSASSAAEELSEVQRLRGQAVEALSETSNFRDQIRTALERTQQDEQTTSRLAEVSGSVEQRVADYEGQLKALKTDYEETKKHILDLLPAATSTGLAAAFHAQASKYRTPRISWNIAFFVSIAGLVTIGGSELARTWTAAAPSYDELLRSLLIRLPIVGGLLWLGLLAAARSRQAGLIQEMYAHKEAVSRSFEGYKAQFAKLGDNFAEGSPVTNLCDRVIETITTPPTHTEELRKKDPTPVTATVEAVGPLLDKVNDLVDTVGRIRR
jgi:hypothetical protein